MKKTFKFSGDSSVTIETDSKWVGGAFGLNVLETTRKYKKEILGNQIPLCIGKMFENGDHKLLCILASVGLDSAIKQSLKEAFSEIQN